MGPDYGSSQGPFCFSRYKCCMMGAGILMSIIKTLVLLTKRLIFGCSGFLAPAWFSGGGCVRQDGFLSLVSMNVVFLLCATVGVEVRWGFLAGHGTGRELPFILISPHSLGQLGQLPSLSF